MAANLVHGEQYKGQHPEFDEFYVLNNYEFRTPDIAPVEGGSEWDDGYKPTWESSNTNV